MASRQQPLPPQPWAPLPYLPRLGPGAENMAGYSPGAQRSYRAPGYENFDPTGAQPVQPVPPPGQYGPLTGTGAPPMGPNLTDPTTQFGPNQNLIGTQFGPNQNLIGTQFNPTPSPDTAAARAVIMSQYGALANQPNRQALAEQSYQALANLDAANLGRDIQGAGQRAAQFGRLGSGMVTAETGDIFGQHQAELANIKAQLAAGTAGQQLQDQLNRLGAAQGVTGQLAGLDTERYGQLAGERGYQAAQSQQAYNNALAAAGLTQPNPLATEIGGQYGQQGQNALAGAGNTLAQIFALTGKRPYQYGGGQSGGQGDYPSYG